jgi:hypothetical protein
MGFINWNVQTASLHKGEGQGCCRTAGTDTRAFRSRMEAGLDTLVIVGPMGVVGVAAMYVYYD